MTTVDASEVATHFAEYLQRVASGETVLIAVENKPVAELRGATGAPLAPRPFGLCAGEFLVPEDFDAPLPEDIVSAFEQP